MSVRAYDDRHFMIGAEVTAGANLEAVINKQLSEKAVQYIHVHNANPGCFNCVVHRA